MRYSISNLWRIQPSVLLLQQVHVSVKVIEILVLQHNVIDQVPLTACVVVALVVADSWKIQPLRVTKLISCQHQVQHTTSIGCASKLLNINK